MSFFMDNIEWTAPIFWVALMVVFVILESITLDLTSIWFAIGSLVATILALIIPEQILIQAFAMLVVSLTCILFVKKIAKEKLAVGQHETNVNAMVGKRGVVTKQIQEFEFGEVKLDGVYWTATFAKDQSKETITEGSIVEVVEIGGAKVFIKLINQSNLES